MKKVIKRNNSVIIVERENEINDFVLNTHINDNNEVLRLKNSKNKINNIDFKELSEDEKDIYKPPHINGQQGSERNKLNTINDGLEIKVNDSNINIINDNDRQNRKQIINQHMQSTTLISNQIRSLEIKIDNKNSEN